MSMTQQRTSEWFAQRKGKITGSIAGAILGLSPHLTRDAVMRRMVRDWHGAEKEGLKLNVNYILRQKMDLLPMGDIS